MHQSLMERFAWGAVLPPAKTRRLFLGHSRNPQSLMIKNPLYKCMVSNKIAVQNGTTATAIAESQSFLDLCELLHQQVPEQSHRQHDSAVPHWVGQKAPSSLKLLEQYENIPFP